MGSLAGLSRLEAGEVGHLTLDCKAGGSKLTVCFKKPAARPCKARPSETNDSIWERSSDLGKLDDLTSPCLQVSKDPRADARSEATSRQTDGHLKAELSSQRELVSRLHAEVATGTKERCAIIHLQERPRIWIAETRISDESLHKPEWKASK